MILSITTTHSPATDLGYLLAKHPERVQEFSLKTGTARVFYPERTDERCTAVLMLSIDPIDLVRRRKGKGGAEAFPLRHYVNDRPWVASSLMSTAILSVFRTAISGTCKERPDLVTQPIPLTLELPVVASREGSTIFRRLFTPLGYEVDAELLDLDRQFPEWGPGSYYRLRLTGTVRLSDALRHLYVLLPVLDESKHYWVDRSEVDKLLEKGEGWLADHPESEMIARRYLLRRRPYITEALERLDEAEAEEERQIEEVLDQRGSGIGLHGIRLARVTEILRDAAPERVVDLGCGEGKLLERLVQETSIPSVLGVDVSSSELTRAERRLERLAPMMRDRIELIQGSVLYRDRRIEGGGAAALVEVIEHIDPDRLETFEQVVFGHGGFETIVLTTPNQEYNVLWEVLEAGDLRHDDHRFEWTGAEFESWCEKIAEAYGYSYVVEELGPRDQAEYDIVTPSQLAHFTR